MKRITASSNNANIVFLEKTKMGLIESLRGSPGPILMAAENAASALQALKTTIELANRELESGRAGVAHGLLAGACANILPKL